MKNLWLLFIVLLGTYPMDAQLHLGLRAGVHSSDLSPGDFIGINGSNENLGLQVQNADYGLHAGFYLEIGIGNFFIRPEATMSTQKVDFRLTDLDEIGVLGDLFTERYNILDVPFQIGTRFGPFYLLGGPSAHFFVSGDSDLYDLPDYDQQWESLSMGYLAGIGLKLGRIGIDMRYEGNLTAFGDHMRFFGQEVVFDDKPSRLLAGLTLEF